MNFYKQFLAEMKQMMKSKFILISGILLFTIICVVTPIIISISDNKEDRYDTNFTIIVDGVEIPCRNEIATQLANLMDKEKYYQENMTSEKAVKYAGDYLDTLIDYLSEYALITMGEKDYRTDMFYDILGRFKENYMLEIEDPDILVLKEVLENITYDYSMIELLSLSNEEQQAKIDENKTILDIYDKLMVEDDFSIYIDIQKENFALEIENYKQQIELLEKSLIDNPSQEDYVNSQIKNINASIDNINSNEIPALDYRLEKNIIPGDDSWQDRALSSKTFSLCQIIDYKKNIITEAEFQENEWLVAENGSYQKYLAEIEAKILEEEYKILVADESLNSGKPDMDFVPQGARAMAHGFINVAIFIGVFAILIGGCSISTEFQNGTIRLLMIRPRLRMKVLFSRYLAGLKLSYILYFIIFIVTIITMGFMYGFSDYLYPNYTPNGEVNFFLLFIQELIITSFSMIFLYSLAFAISTIIRNSAVAIIIPTLAVLGSIILVPMMYQFVSMDWISFTPFLYISMHDFFYEYSLLQKLVNEGMTLSPTLGMINLSVYSAILVGLSAFIFKKTDITN